MSLKSIRTDIASKVGYHPDTSDDDRIFLDSEINGIIRPFYVSNDQVGSLFEIIVFYDIESKLVSLPSFVGHIRGARYYDNPYKHTLRDIRPRYAKEMYGVELLDFREVGTSTLAIQPEEWGKLKFALPEGEVSEKDLVIAIVGETPVASRVEEQLILAKDGNSVTSVNSWKEAPKVIRKDAANNFNITVTDINDVEVAIIPNHQLNSQYSVWQVRDDSMSGQLSGNSLEILFKERLPELVNDYDEFLDGRYDDVIVWQFLEQYYAQQEGKEKLSEAARDQWQLNLVDLNRDHARSKKAEEQAVPNKFYGLFNSTSYRSHLYNQ